MQQESQLKWDQFYEDLRTYLPIQNPLSSFLHNNLLFAFENKDFWQAGDMASDLYGASFPPSLAFYHECYRSGRISEESLRDACAAFEKKQSPFLTPSTATNLALRSNDPKTDARARQLIVASTIDRNLRVPSWTTQNTNSPALSLDRREWLARILESYLDLGIAPHRNPFYTRGLLSFVRLWVHDSMILQSDWQLQLKQSIDQICAHPLAYIEGVFQSSGLNQEAWTRAILRSCFSLKGWSGMFNKAEVTPEYFSRTPAKSSLKEFIAIVAFLQVSQKPNWNNLGRPFGGDASQNEFEERKIWQVAYELETYRRLLTRVCESHHNNLRTQAQRSIQPQKQAAFFFCIDDREESLRRKVEEEFPEFPTFGVLGNFNIDMMFRAQGSEKPSIRCPPVVRPRRVVHEVRALDMSVRKNHSLSDFFLKNLEEIQASIAMDIVSPVRNWIASIFLAPLTASLAMLKAIVPSVMIRLRETRHLHHQLSRLKDVDLTRRHDERWGESGYTENEQAEFVETILRHAGMVRDFPKFLFLIAHESTSRNNPFGQAYGCGACSGNSGAASAKVFAKMANNPAVRAILKKQNIEIPDSTKFIPCCHDTTADIVYFLDEISTKHFSTEDVKTIGGYQVKMMRALENNAAERSRRFANAQKRVKMNPKEAHAHARMRSLSLAEPRPEYGHSGVCMAVFGRRLHTLGVNLERRSFLVSYDYATDREGKTLKGLIEGALPVVANINLDYFFSSVDPHGFGSGSKLPLNISGLIGVVTGSRGDLRVGLPTQMVEVHEPLRALALIEAPCEILEPILKGHSRLKRLVENGWMHVVAIEPDTAALRQFTLQGWQDVGSLNSSPADRKKDVAITVTPTLGVIYDLG